MLTQIMNQIPRITVNNFQKIWIEKLHVLNFKKREILNWDLIQIPLWICDFKRLVCNL